MPDPITNVAFANALGDEIDKRVTGVYTVDQLKTAILETVNSFFIGGTTPAQLGAQFTNVMGNWSLYVQGQLEWATIPADGGPYDNGTVDLVDYLGNVVNTPGLNKIIADAQIAIEVVAAAEEILAARDEAVDAAVDADLDATNAYNLAQKTDGLVLGVNSAKSWAVGGTGAGQPSLGDAKSWATSLSVVAGGLYGAKYYATAAAASESAASGYATTATTQAGIATGAATTATTQAGIATTKASEASTSASSAAGSATTATTQAGIATTKAGEAATSASDALSYRNTALTYRNDAQTALADAITARNLAQSWASSTSVVSGGYYGAYKYAVDAAASAASALNAPGTNATSTTSLSIATGTKSLTIQTGKAYAVGQAVGIARTSDPANSLMAGIITAHDNTTGALTVQVSLVKGSGTFTDWTISLTSLSSILADPLQYIGTIDCSTNPNYPAAEGGYVYIVSVAGKIGGASGTNVEPGDWLICRVDGSPAGTQAAVGANWNIVQANIDGAVVGPASANDNEIALFNGATGKIIKSAGILMSAVALLTSAQTLQNKTLDNTNIITVKAANLTIQDGTDTTKQAKFSAASITTGTTRTFTLPDVSGTLVVVDATQTLTNKTLTAPVINNGTMDGTVIGGTNKEAGGFTTLAVSGIATFTATSGSAINLDTAAGNYRLITFKTAGTNRFAFGVDNVAEAGSDAGTNLHIYKYTDAGVVSDALTINRSTGLVNILGAMTLTGLATLTGGLLANNTITSAVATYATQADYLVLKPTDYAASKPGLFITHFPTYWNIGLWDGSSSAGTINFSSAVTVASTLGVTSTLTVDPNADALNMLYLRGAASSYRIQSISTGGITLDAVNRGVTVYNLMRMRASNWSWNDGSVDLMTLSGAGTLGFSGNLNLNASNSSISGGSTGGSTQYVSDPSASIAGAFLQLYGSTSGAPGRVVLGRASAAVIDITSTGTAITGALTSTGTTTFQSTANSSTVYPLVLKNLGTGAGTAVGISFQAASFGVSSRDAQIIAENNGSNQVKLMFLTANGTAPVVAMTISHDQSTNFAYVVSSVRALANYEGMYVKANVAPVVGQIAGFSCYPSTGSGRAIFSGRVSSANGGDVAAVIYSSAGGSGTPVVYFNPDLTTTFNNGIFGSSDNTKDMGSLSTRWANLFIGSSINLGTSTDPINTSTNGIKIGIGTIEASISAAPLFYLARRTSDGAIINFYRDTSGVGSISVTSTATAYNTSSDYRLKENVTPLVNALDRLMLLKPSRFNFKSTPGHFVEGFLAHEVQAVVPEAITGYKDETDEEGNPIYQGIDQSKLIPLAVAAIRELRAENNSLRDQIEMMNNRLEALEAA